VRRRIPLCPWKQTFACAAPSDATGQLRSCRHRAGGLGKELVAANICRWESVLILINEILPVTITLARETEFMGNVGSVSKKE
jgi:hypothetical protein